MEQKKVLVLGYGIMGRFLVQELRQMGYLVDVICLERIIQDDPGICFTQADCFQEGFLKQRLEGGCYDAVVDFLLYTTPRFRQMHELYLKKRHITFSCPPDLYQSPAAAPVRLPSQPCTSLQDPAGSNRA